MPDSGTIRLSQLATRIEQVLEDAFSTMQFWVIADVTNHTHKVNSNYHYFELVEKVPGSDKLIAKFSAKAWGSGANELALFEKRTGQKFTNNIQVLIRVRVQYHATYSIQLDVTGIDTNFTLGVIEQQRQITLERLCRENAKHIQKRGEEYWTRNKSLQLPLVIQRIAVVCAKDSAGWQDFHHTMENNTYGYRFELSPYFTGVQGEANADAMRKRMLDIFNAPVKYDLVVIIRGGGAQTDFLIFDHYAVGQVIARFPIPVMTGIGHQKNITIADLMAHTSVKTPTKAAESIIDHNRRFQELLLTVQQNIIMKVQQGLVVRNGQLDKLRAQVTNDAHRLISLNKDSLYEIQQRIIGQGRAIPFQHRIGISNLAASLLSQPKIILAAKRKDLEHNADNIRYYQAAFLKNRREYLNYYISYVKNVSPESTLKRGFAMVIYNGKIISDPDLLNTGDKFSVIMRDKELLTTLQNKKDYNGS